MKHFKTDDQVRKEFQARFMSKHTGTQKIILEKPLIGKTFHSCGAIKLYADLGLGQFLTKLTHVCFPELVSEFYGNYHVENYKFIRLLVGLIFS